MKRLLEVAPKLKVLEERKSPFLKNINDAIKYAEDILKEIKNTFDNYTNHDIEHSFSVIKYMVDVVTDINELSDLELVIIIYAGLFHDIGMVVTDEEKILVQNNRYKLSPYNYASVLESCEQNAYIAMQEIIRPIHALRSREHILKNMYTQKHYFEVCGINGVYFDELLADICVAHNEEFEWINLNLESDVKLGQYSVNAQYIAILLRLGDLLDIDSKRTPDYLYNLISPKGLSDDEWRQHFVITNSEKIVLLENNIKNIEFYGDTKDAKIHRKILNYIDWIKKELENATNLLNQSTFDKYHLNISTNINNEIKPRNFEFSNLKLSLDYNSITNLLMGENIYNDKKCGLREIIQNSIDACKLMKEEAKNLEEYKFGPYKPKIIIRIDDNSVSIYDNGIGMSLDIIKKYFLNVGVSYYNSNDCKYRGYSYMPIGNYGIGFLACFMLSNTVKIKTKRFDSNDTYIVDVEKNNEYVILNKEAYNAISFTEIILDKTFFAVFCNVESIKKYIEQTFLDDEIEIFIQENNADGNYLETKCNLMRLNYDNQDNICLSQYLNGIEAYATINNKLLYISSLNDISENNYIYFNEEFQKYNENIHNIDLLINNNELSYVTIILITNSLQEKMDSFFEAFDDYGEAVEKLDTVEELERIRIYYNSSQIEFADERQYVSILSAEDVPIFRDGFSVFDCLCNIDSQDLLCTNISAVYMDTGKKQIVGIKENTYLTFAKENGVYWYGRDARYLFVRNVFINRYNLSIPQIASGVRINSIVANILNRTVIPDISRSNIQMENTQKINNAIGKAIHLWIYYNAELSPTEKMVLREFINLNYSENNELTAKEYNNLIQ